MSIHYRDFLLLGCTFRDAFCTSRPTSSAEVPFLESPWCPLDDPLSSACEVGRVWLLGGYKTDKTTKIRKFRQRYARRYAHMIAGSYPNTPSGPHGQGLQLSYWKHFMNHRRYEDTPKDVFFTSQRILKIRGWLGTWFFLSRAAFDMADPNITPQWGVGSFGDVS